MKQLTDKAYARKLSRRSARPGDADVVVSRRRCAKARRRRTTPSRTRNGNAVATTTTLNALYGSGVYVRGGGFFLNDEMDDFAAAPGKPNMFGLVQGEANAIQPGKRMLSAMSPTIVLDRDGGLLLVVGSRGGPRIITSTSQVILNVLDNHMILSDAVSAPRIHHQALPDSLLVRAPGTLDRRDGLVAGDGVRRSVDGRRWLDQRDHARRGGYEGMSDPRSSGKPAGY